MTAFGYILTGAAVLVAASACHHAQRAHESSRQVAGLLMRAERRWSKRHDLATAEQEAAALLVSTTTLADIAAARQRLEENSWART